MLENAFLSCIRSKGETSRNKNIDNNVDDNDEEFQVHEVLSDGRGGRLEPIKSSKCLATPNEVRHEVYS